MRNGLSVTPAIGRQHHVGREPEGTQLHLRPAARARRGWPGASGGRGCTAPCRGCAVAKCGIQRAGVRCGPHAASSRAASAGGVATSAAPGGCSAPSGCMSRPPASAYIGVAHHPAMLALRGSTGGRLGLLRGNRQSAVDAARSARHRATAARRGGVPLAGQDHLAVAGLEVELVLPVASLADPDCRPHASSQPRRPGIPGQAGVR